VNGFYAELIVRVLVKTERLERTSSSVVAVFLSIALQFSYHLDHGWRKALSLSADFLFLSLDYLRTRMATTVLSAHVLVDIILVQPRL
jgi:Type II CAAX prenyl endopeptidase Rce1-like